MPDSMTPYLQDLKNEIAGDPENLGYSGLSNEEIADLISSLETGRTVDTGAVESYLVVNAFEAAEIVSLTSIQLQLLNLIVSAGTVDTSNVKIQAFFLNLFVAGTTTRANLVALAKRPASRAEELGWPSKIQDYHVIRSNNL